MVSTTFVTAEDLWEMQDEPFRFDLIEGELFRMPGGRHGRVTARFVMRLGLFVEENNLGAVYSNDTGFTLERGPDTTLCPDIAFVQSDRLPSEEQEIGFLDLAPDLAVEIVSPSDSRPFVLRKVAKYFAQGTRTVLTVFPASRTVEVHQSDGTVTVLGVGDVLDGGDVLPGFSVAIADLFPTR